jgi:hypothetical protein
MDLKENRLYRNKADSNKVVVVKEINNNEVTFLHAPPIDSDIHWFVPPKRDTLSLSDFTSTYKPFKQ